MSEVTHKVFEDERDAQSVTKIWLRGLEANAAIARNPLRIFPTVIEERAVNGGQNIALYSSHENFTYLELASRANQYARWAIAQGLAKGDVVCLLMPNRAEYMAVWVGITSIGGIVSLLNFNLVGASLAHCIRITAPTHIIVDQENLDVLSTAQKDLPDGVEIWVHGSRAPDFRSIDAELERYSGQELSSRERRSVTLQDCALYVHTSGTTGLPKAAKVTHYRIMQWTHWFAAIMKMQRSDRLYDCLPMYHSIGGVVAPGAVLVGGGAAVIRPKFSATRFWAEIAEFNCTIFQYIGELCRYLLHTPYHPQETSHRLRLCCGNGLRPEIWNGFKERFGIPHILEFYASTEGNVALYNLEERPGAIGRVPGFLGHRSRVAIIRVDPEGRTPVRNDAGFCIQCVAKEVGEAVGRIDGNVTSPQAFDGYTERNESESKVVYDVFSRGDAWFRTGDLMYLDQGQFFHFVDRVGDTFRWKGENVSTIEVADVIRTFPGIVDAAVYGVAVPHNEGKVGMAALVTNEHFGFEQFARFLKQKLPAYAIPFFVRICQALDITSTFKYKKSELIQRSYAPDSLHEPVYVMDPERSIYVPLDRTMYDRIRVGLVRL